MIDSTCAVKLREAEKGSDSIPWLASESPLASGDSVRRGVDGSCRHAPARLSVADVADCSAYYNLARSVTRQNTLG